MAQAGRPVTTLFVPMQAAALRPARPKRGPSFLRPVGVGDLLIVRQRLKGYRGGEVSYIENVLKSENRTRKHTRRLLSEQTFLVETEREEREERDLQTTERAELSREVEEVLNEQLKAEAGVKTSSYGPTRIETNAQVAVDKSRENSARSANNYTRETVDKTVKRVTERIRRQRTTRIVEEVEEFSHHEFDNREGDDHVVGIYQWYDKVYEAQIYNYGQRELYEMIVPEPAALLIAAAASENALEVGVEKPDPTPLDDADVSTIEDVYQDLVEEYGVVGVKPPPAEWQTIGKLFTSVGSTAATSQHFAGEELVEIPEGYEVVRGTIEISTKSDDPGLTPHVDVQISHYSVSLGKDTFRAAGALGEAEKFFFDFSNAHLEIGPFTLEGRRALPRGKLPVSVAADDYDVIAVNITVECRRTNEAMNKWRLDTFSAIQQTYLERLAEYNAAFKQAVVEQVNSELPIGRNPAANQRIVATELQRAAITVMRNEQLDDFDAINIEMVYNELNEEDELPLIDLDARERIEPEIQFLHHAFEWENMTYVLYPYFWGRPADTWKVKVLSEDVDPLFVEFLKAGAARVQVPVRPGFRGAVRHYMQTGEPYFGGDLPDIDDELYVPFVEEKKAILGAPGNEVPWDDPDNPGPWEVVVPTTLVKLRSDNEFPRWQDPTTGEWEAGSGEV